MDSGVVPFHQPGAGSVVCTVSVPDLTGVMLMLFALLVMSQLPIWGFPEELVLVDESDDPQALTAAVMANALIRPMVRLSSMEMSFRRKAKTGNVACEQRAGQGRESQAPGR